MQRHNYTSVAFMSRFGPLAQPVFRRFFPAKVSDRYVICPRDSLFARYKAYQSFRDKGWIVRHGTEFGVDFLLYSRSPDDIHAAYGPAFLVTLKSDVIPFPCPSAQFSFSSFLSSLCLLLGGKAFTRGRAHDSTAHCCRVMTHGPPSRVHFSVAQNRKTNLRPGKWVPQVLANPAGFGLRLP